MTNINRFSRQSEADKFYLARARDVARYTDDPKAASNPRSAVGAVIVRNNQIIAESANVIPSALKSHLVRSGISVGEHERYHVIEHAERAAIFAAFLTGQNTKNSVIYCTRFPCSDCARAISWAGIVRVVVTSGFQGEAHWLDSQRAALRILRGSGIVVRIFPRNSAYGG